jgi:uncharacterized membrane protein
MQFSTIAAAVALLGFSSVALAGPPEYTIVDMGVVDPGDFSQAFRISPGGVATGRSNGNSNQAYSWSEGAGFAALPNLASPLRPYGVGNGANDSGAIVGTGATTFFGSSALPIIWQDGVASQLPLPAGQTLGRANDINASGIAVGSVDGGSAEAAVIYAGIHTEIITATTPGGVFMTVAFSINDDGLVVGQGSDPNNAARNVGFVYNMSTDTATEVGALSGLNGALAFDVSNAGHVVGSSMMNQGSGTPFIWTEKGDMTAIPLPAGTSQGSARGVNSAGWAVGTASSAFAIPFLYDGTTTHRVADLLPPGSGWDLDMNTSSSAMGISEDGVIVGTGIHNGDTRAYAMIPVVTSCDGDTNGDGMVNVDDLNNVILDWGTDGSANGGDITGSTPGSGPDGAVNVNDLNAVIVAWGLCP